MSRRVWWAAGAAVLVAGAVVLVWFQPQKLLIDERVEEAAPVAVAAPSPGSSGGADGTSEPAADTGDLSGGRFISIDHTTSGVVRVLDVGDGTRVVRLEGLATDNGPDLYLYLSTNAADGAEAAFDDEFVSLGRLKGNQGDQNYELPSDVDLDRYASVVIWCDRFDSAFGAAALTA